MQDINVKQDNANAYRLELPLGNEAFWAKIKVGAVNECWPYKEALRRGYGKFWNGLKEVQAHRMALIIWGGGDCPQLHALHSCDNRACCNPHHLRWGNRSENMKDRNERNPEWRQKNGKRMADVGRLSGPRNAEKMKHLLPSQEDYVLKLICAGFKTKKIASCYAVSTHVIYKTKYRGFKYAA